jgi:hypothetical protein
VVRSIADADRGGGPPDPTDDARGGPAPVEGVGIALEVLIPGEAVWARGGGGGGAAFAASLTSAFENNHERFSSIRM